MISAHEPPIKSDRGVVEKIVSNDPVKLRVRVLRGNTLVKAVSVVVRILFRGSLGIRQHFRRAAPALVASPESWPMAPIKTFAHSEVRCEIVIDSELNHPSIENPGLIAGRVSGHVECESGAVWVIHESGNPGGHKAQLRIIRRNDICLTADRKSRRGIETKAVPHGNAADVSSSTGIKNLSLIDGSPKNIRRNHIVRVEQRTEISRLESVRWGRIAKSRQHSLAHAGPVDIRKEECLVTPVVDFWDYDRTAQGKSEGIVFQGAFIARSAMPSSIAVCIEKRRH